MVVWTNLFPADPVGGAMVAYGRAVAVTPPYNEPWGTPSGVFYYLASPGTVDANVSTRFQYRNAYAPGSSALPVIVYGAFTFDATDVSNAAGRTMGITAFMAPASSFGAGVTPTPQQIIDAAPVVSRASTGRTTAGNVKDSVTLLPVTSDWVPNTKFWVVVVPTFYNPASLPSKANDAVVTTQPVNTIGRAISFWTNRTPDAPTFIGPKNFVKRSGEAFYVPMSFKNSDAITSFSGDRGKDDFDDVSGIQVQYAPKPSAANPTPTWSDLPFQGAIPVLDPIGPGWFIDGSNAMTLSQRDKSGAAAAWETQRLLIQCGVSNYGYGALLPEGDWQIRVRVFDYGHPYPNSTGNNPWIGVGTRPAALMDPTGNFTADTFPAVNTSPWSEVINVSVSQRVPAPIPLNPINSIAVLDTTPITLSWQYRNAYVVPQTQKTRSVRIRRVGDAAWTDLVIDQASASSELAMAGTGFTFVSGNQYEWQVQVTDAFDARSPWSASGRFWLVPPPSSGSVIPTPSDTIDGATLGCGTHTVEIYRRGGLVKVGTLDGVAKVEWGRLRDDISNAVITLKSWGVDCGELLRDLDPWAYEVVLWRDNGYSVDRVWEGPITLLTYKNDEVRIQAKDVMAYLYRRIIKQAINDGLNSPTAGRSVVARAVEIIQNAFAPDDPNVLAYLEGIIQPDDAKQYRSTPEYSRTAYEEVDDMASNAGLDYVTVGRAILLWGTKHRIGTLPEFGDKDLGESPIVSVYGMSMANRYAISDGNGVWGEATRLNEDDEDPYYGLVEMLSSTWASDSESDTGTYTQEALEKKRASFAASAERSIDDRYPAPVVVRVPDNTTINPDAVVSINNLVPGVIIPLRTTGGLREVVASQKLDSVKVVEEAGKETISVIMSPFNRDDADPGEGGEG